MGFVVSKPSSKFISNGRKGFENIFFLPFGTYFFVPITEITEMSKHYLKKPSWLV